MNYLLSFAGYTFPNTLRCDGGDQGVDLAESERPRADGSVSQAGRKKSRLLTVRGDVQGDTPDQLWQAMDALRAACGQGTVGPLFFGRDDRFFNAQVESFADAYTEGLLWGCVASISIGFRACQPYALASAPTTAPGLIATGGTVTPGGNAPTFATWTLGIMGGGTGTMTLTNAATGEACTLGTPATAWNAGDSVVLTRDGSGVYAVTLNGTSAPGLLVGLIPTLAVGANALSLAQTGGLVLMGLRCTYTARWQS